MSLLARSVARLDSFLNTITGLGDRSRDKTRQMVQQFDGVLSTRYIESLLSSSDLAWTITAELVEEAMKDGFGLTTGEGEKAAETVAQQAQAILKEGERLGLQDKFVEAAIWGRAYGLSGLVLGITGAGMPDTPLREDAPGARLAWLLVVDKRELIPARYYTDPNAEKFGEVEIYRITPASNAGSPGMEIHETRIIRFGGVMTSRIERQRNQGADYSALQRILPVLESTEQNWGAVCQLMADMSQGVYSVSGLHDMIAAGNEDTIAQRMKLLDMSRSVSRSIVVDANTEKFERVVTPMQGVAEAVMQTWQRLAAAARMPLTVLLGISPAGLNATGASDIRLWYDKITRVRQHVYAPRILRIVRIIARTLGQEDPEDWGVSWPSLWTMTAPEQADVYLKTAQADQIYLSRGVYRPEEVALSRCANGDEFNTGKVSIDADARRKSVAQLPKELPPDSESPTGSPPDGTRSISNMPAE